MSASPAEARIEQLEKIEEDVIAILKSAGTCLVEISKDRPSQKAVDGNVQQVYYNIFYHLEQVFHHNSWINYG